MSLGRYWVRYRRWDELDTEAQMDALIASCEDAEYRGAL